MAAAVALLSALAQVGVDGEGVRLQAAAVTCVSVILRWPAARGVSVLEYGAWWRQLRGAGAEAEGVPMQRFATNNLVDTSLELTGLRPGSHYAFEVRARTAAGWHLYTNTLEEWTMAPSDFPLPILAPEVRGMIGCTAILLGLPTLRFCHTTTHMGLQYQHGGEDGSTWQMMRENVLGGDIQVDGLDPYATHSFRLIGFEQGTEARPAAGAATPPILTDMLAATLTQPPRARATSSASFVLSWSGDSRCRPEARWRLAYRRLADATGEYAATSALADSRPRQLQMAAPPPPPSPLQLSQEAEPAAPASQLIPRRRAAASKGGGGGNCPSGWVPAGGSCFALLPGAALPAANAAKGCGTLASGATLARLDSAAEEAVAAELCGSSPSGKPGIGCWIGEPYPILFAPAPPLPPQPGL